MTISFSELWSGFGLILGSLNFWLTTVLMLVLWYGLSVLLARLFVSRAKEASSVERMEQAGAAAVWWALLGMVLVSSGATFAIWNQQGLYASVSMGVVMLVLGLLLILTVFRRSKRA